jgi:predicted restriction endonuclease
VSNVLCLCPNDHVLFDRGAIYVADDLEVIERATGRSRGKLRLAAAHRPSPMHFADHRALFDSTGL